MKKKVLFVCLGNICRSPAAEAVFIRLLKLKNMENDFYVDSAGTGGWHAGNPADPRMKNAALKRGIDIISLSRKITDKDFYDFDWIITMDNDNFNTVNSISKSLKVNPNLKILPILGLPNKEKILEVPDPYYGGENGFEEVLDLLETSCEELLEYISNSS